MRLNTFSEEICDSILVNVVKRRPLASHVFPMYSHFAQEEIMKGSPSEFLLGGTASLIVNSTVRNRDIACRNNNLNHVLPVHYHMVHFRHNPEQCNNLVGNVLQLLLYLGHTNYGMVVINAYVDLTTLSIRKAADLLENIIFPNAFVFYVLLFVFHFSDQSGKSPNSNNAKLAKNSDIPLIYRHLFIIAFTLEKAIRGGGELRYRARLVGGGGLFSRLSRRYVTVDEPLKHIDRSPTMSNS